MAKFRTKPFEIEAVRLETGMDYGMVCDFTGWDIFRLNSETDRYEVYDYLHDTWVGVSIGQWIIKGQKGEFYPCDPEIFEAKYEAI